MIWRAYILDRRHWSVARFSICTCSIRSMRSLWSYPSALNKKQCGSDHFIGFQDVEYIRWRNYMLEKQFSDDWSPSFMFCSRRAAGGVGRKTFFFYTCFFFWSRVRWYTSCGCHRAEKVPYGSSVSRDMCNKSTMVVDQQPQLSLTSNKRLNCCAKTILYCLTAFL